MVTWKQGYVTTKIEEYIIYPSQIDYIHLLECEFERRNRWKTEHEYQME